MVDGFDNKLSLVVQCLFGLLSLLAIRFVVALRGPEFPAQSAAASQLISRLSSWVVLRQPEGWLVGKVRLLPLAVRAVPPDSALHRREQPTHHGVGLQSLPRR